MSSSGSRLHVVAVVFTLLCLSACNRGSDGEGATSPSDDVMQQLQAAMTATIDNDARDREVTQLVQRAIREQLLVGLTIAEIEEKLGPSQPCGDGGWCTFFDLAPDDRYYEVGTLPDGWVGGVPMLILDIDEANRCSQVHFVHGQ